MCSTRQGCCLGEKGIMILLMVSEMAIVSTFKPEWDHYTINSIKNGYIKALAEIKKRFEEYLDGITKGKEPVKVRIVLERAFNLII